MLERDLLVVKASRACPVPVLFVGYMIGAGVPVAARYATKYQVTYEIVGYLQLDVWTNRQVRRYAVQTT